MSDDYLRAKIGEAIASTGGHRQDAQTLLITWAVRDFRLLLEMVKPQLKAIAAGHIEHELRARQPVPDAPAAAGPDHLAQSTIDGIVASSARVADKRKTANLPPPKSTERQASAMRKIAEAYKKK